MGEHAGPDTYDDRLVRLDAQGIRIARYYFPLARPRVIAWADVRGYEVHDLGVWSGRFRGWGSHRADWWFPLDLRRFRKDRCIVLDVPGTHPAITPENVDAARAVLDLHLDRHA